MEVKVLYQPPVNGDAVGSIFLVIVKDHYLEVKEQVDRTIKPLQLRLEYDLTLPSDEEIKVMKKQAYRRFKQAIKAIAHHY
ncbi:hypothetical protein ES703_15029 [subsurface metagenome]